MATFTVRTPRAYDSNNCPRVIVHGEHPTTGFVWLFYTDWLQKTNTNPQVGDRVDLDDRYQILGLTLEERA